MHRQKDVQYASRAHSHIVRQKQIYRLRHIIAELSARLPPEERAKPEVDDMAGYGCLTQMHVVRLLAPGLEGEDSQKDIDFSPSGIAARWQGGLENTPRRYCRPHPGKNLLIRWKASCCTRPWAHGTSQPLQTKQ